MDHDEGEVYKNTQKEDNIHPSWRNKLGQERINFVAKKRTFSCVTNAGNLDRPILPARVANKNTGFAWYYPLFNDAQILAKLLLTDTLKMKMKSFETRL